MVSFRFNEIPKGVSHDQLMLEAEDLDIEDSAISRIRLSMRFNKQDDNLRIECHVVTEAVFTCDRSLEVFQTELEGTYEVVFQLNVEDEKEELSGTLRRLDPAQNQIDISREVRDTVLLSIPIKKLHPRYLQKGEITGFEASYGSEPDSEDHDPRWDALAKLKQKIQKN